MAVDKTYQEEIDSVLEEELDNIVVNLIGRIDILEEKNHCTRLTIKDYKHQLEKINEDIKSIRSNMILLLLMMFTLFFVSMIH